jgi:hypothetical protein
MIGPLAFALALSAGTAPADLPGPCVLQRCTCIESPDPRLAMDAADAVFLGSAVDVQETTTHLTDGSDRIPSRTVTFRLHAGWKGLEASVQEVTVTTGHGDGDCGFEFQPGTAYLVYARKGEQGLSTSICSRTAAAEHALADFDALGHPPIVRHQ